MQGRPQTESLWGLRKGPNSLCFSLSHPRGRGESHASLGSEDCGYYFSLFLMTSICSVPQSKSRSASLPQYSRTSIFLAWPFLVCAEALPGHSLKGEPSPTLRNQRAPKPRIKSVPFIIPGATRFPRQAQTLLEDIGRTECKINTDFSTWRILPASDSKEEGIANISPVWLWWRNPLSSEIWPCHKNRLHSESKTSVFRRLPLGPCQSSHF